MTIIVVGLGPGCPEMLTLEAERVLRAAKIVHIRTHRHPTVEYLRMLGIPVRAYDDVYEHGESLPAVYEEIVRRLVDAYREDGMELIYAVPGHPCVGETTTDLLRHRAGQGEISLRVVEGLSFIEPAARAAGIDLLDGVQIMDGLDLIAQPFPMLDPDRGILLGQVYNAQIASDVKLALSEIYPDDHEVLLMRALSTSEEHVQRIPLFELDRQAGIDHLTSLYVPPLPSSGSWLGLQNIVARLRSPGGCPWDREQTHRTLRTHLLDETYEVLDALDRDDADDLCSELGDLALQIALHMQIAREEGEFRPTDVFSRIIAKLRRRHPHVFGNLQVSGAGEVLVNWEHIKREEKGSEDNSHQLDGVPASLPALAQALTYQQRAARVGYVLQDEERLAQLMATLLGPGQVSDPERFVGDLLFSLVSLVRSRFPDLNPESALREANARFAERFQRDQRNHATPTSREVGA